MEGITEYSKNTLEPKIFKNIEILAQLKSDKINMSVSLEYKN